MGKGRPAARRPRLPGDHPSGDGPVARARRGGPGQGERPPRWRGPRGQAGEVPAFPRRRVGADPDRPSDRQASAHPAAADGGPRTCSLNSPAKFTFGKWSTKWSAAGTAACGSACGRRCWTKRRHPAEALAGLYLRRWQIEVGFRDLKQTANASGDAGPEPRSGLEGVLVAHPRVQPGADGGERSRGAARGRRLPGQLHLSALRFLRRLTTPEGRTSIEGSTASS